MAVLKRRLNRKTTSGFDVVHLETEASLVLRTSGGSNVEKSLTALEEKAHETNTPSTETETQATPAYGESFTVVSGVTTKETGHVDKVSTKSIKLPDGPVAMTGATSEAAGASGYVPAPKKGEQNAFLRGDGTWNLPPEGTVYIHPSDANNVGSFGPSEDAATMHGGTFTVPYVTVNAAGHVTNASTKTITLPSDISVSFADTQPTDQAVGDLWYEPLS